MDDGNFISFNGILKKGLSGDRGDLNLLVEVKSFVCFL